MRFIPFFLCWFSLSLSLNVVAQDMTLSPATYNALNKIQEQLGAQQLTEAEAGLHELEEQLAPGFGLALVHQLHGQLHLMKEESELALQHFREALALNVLSPAQESAIATTTAQLLLQLERPDHALAELEPRLERLLQREQEDRKKSRKGEGDVRYVQPMSLRTVGRAYEVRKQDHPSIRWLKERATRSDSPREGWLLVLVVAGYQEKLGAAPARVLDDLIRLSAGKEDYWQQQASVYQIMEQQALALRTLELGYAAGHIKKPDSILQLVQLLISENLPERAGRILQQHLNDKTLELTE